MKTTIATLALAYVLSQFYRTFLAVLAPLLAADLGTPAEVLAQASGWWFLTFAAAQLPVGWALDRVGPRLTVSVLMAVAALGAVVFALAQSALHINIAMVLIGAGCAPVLMGSYFIFARVHSPAVFGTLAGMVIGVGSLGNIAASVPLSVAADLLGWRGAIWALAGITGLVALVIGLIVRDPPHVRTTGEGSILTLLAMPRLWPVMLMMAAGYPSAAGLRGLWAGPYVTEAFPDQAGQIGLVTLVMGLAMMAGNFAYGPMERLLGTRKWLVFGGNSLLLGCLLALAAWPLAGLGTSTLLLAGVGVFGSSFPMIMAHGRAFMPPALVGRGVTLMNLFGIGAAGLMQMATGRLHAALPGAEGYGTLFLAYAALVATGLTIYVFSQDRRD